MNEYNQNHKKILYEQYRKREEAANKNSMAFSNDETWFKKYKNKTHKANKGIKLKIDEKNDNNRYNNNNDYENQNIKTEYENINLDSARIDMKKYKQNFNMENNTNKEKNNIRFTTKKNSNKDSINNNDNFNNENQFPKRTLTSNFSDININFGNINNNNLNNKKSLLNQKKMNRHNFFSSTDIHQNISINDEKNKNTNWINVRRSFASDSANEGGIKVKKKKYGKKNMFIENIE